MLDSVREATQQAYETMRTYLTRPGARQATWPNSPSCAYRTELDGEVHCCAVGILFTSEDMEHFGTFQGGIDEIYENHEERGEELPAGIKGIDYNLLQAAQEVHDNIDNWRDGVFNAEALDKKAEELGLRPVG